MHMRCDTAHVHSNYKYKLDANTMSRLISCDAASILRYSTGSPKIRAALRTCTEQMFDTR
jgi:hypothetical protein